MIQILIVEDDHHLSHILKTYLIKKSFEVDVAFDGIKALDMISSKKYDLVISDVMMPHMDGISLITKLRGMFPDLPLMILTALDQYQDKEKAFLSGTDDYLVKPVHLPELTLRIEALLRRYKIQMEHQIHLKHLLLDQKTMTCKIDDLFIELTHKEFQLLFKLLSYPNRIFTREELMDEIWGFDSESYDRTVDTHIKRIREHVKVDDFEIITVRGLGYKAVIK